jgi:hypothetical protein
VVNTLNELVGRYTQHLHDGEIQAAYRGIIEFIGKLRADFIKECPHYDIGNIYQGYMDMTYFSLSSEQLKEKGLKIAVVYLHEKGAFEVWLSARNRETAKRYLLMFESANLDRNAFFHEDANQDAIIECTLSSKPDFDDQGDLARTIRKGTKDFESAISNLL